MRVPKYVQEFITMVKQRRIVSAKLAELDGEIDDREERVLLWMIRNGIAEEGQRTPIGDVLLEARTTCEVRRKDITGFKPFAAALRKLGLGRCIHLTYNASVLSKDVRERYTTKGGRWRVPKGLDVVADYWWEEGVVVHDVPKGPKK